jgi:DNA-binding MarR family transcriptional regulator
MRALWEQEHLTSKQISQITLIPAPSLVGILDRLEKKDLLGRLRSVEDRRLVFIRPTKAGRELQEIMLPKIEQIHNFLIERVTSKEWKEMKRILDKLSGHSGPSAKIFGTGN